MKAAASDPPSPVLNGASFRPEDPRSPLCLASAFADLGEVSPAGDVLFSGPSSQFPGLWQVNARVPVGGEI